MTRSYRSPQIAIHDRRVSTDRCVQTVRGRARRRGIQRGCRPPARRHCPPARECASPSSVSLCLAVCWLSRSSCVLLRATVSGRAGAHVGVHAAWQTTSLAREEPALDSDAAGTPAGRALVPPRSGRPGVAVWRRRRSRRALAAPSAQSGSAELDNAGTAGRRTDVPRSNTANSHHPHLPTSSVLLSLHSPLPPR
jgi:hypothetical protein